MHEFVAFRLIHFIQNLSGKLKHVKDNWGEGYPDADQCRLMVDRLCCYLFLKQQEQIEDVQPLQIAYSGQPSADSGVFTSVQRLRKSMGDTADRVLLLLFLMRGEGRAVSSAATLSHNSTPVQPRQFLSVPGALSTTPQHAMLSVFLQPSHQESLFIHPLGKMEVSRL
jgi:hypothetical protein